MRKLYANVYIERGKTKQVEMLSRENEKDQTGNFPYCHIFRSLCN